MQKNLSQAVLSHVSLVLLSKSVLTHQICVIFAAWKGRNMLFSLVWPDRLLLGRELQYPSFGFTPRFKKYTLCAYH